MERMPPDESLTGMAAHNLLHQQLIVVKAQLDRQVAQLIRLNEFSNHLLGSIGERAMTQTFAEAIVDLLDLAFGAVWVLPPYDNLIEPSFAACGASIPQDAWRDVGKALADQLGTEGRVKAVRLDPSAMGLLPGVALVAPIACRCVGHDGRTSAIVLAANTPAIAGIAEPVSDDALGMLALFAEKCAAHIDSTTNHQLIKEQLDQLRLSQEQLALVLKGTNDGWWDWDICSNQCFLSGQWLQILGEPQADFCTQNGFWFDRVHPQDLTGFQLLLKQSIAEATPNVEMELSLQHADGSWVPVLVRGMILRGPEGKAVRFAGSVQDLRERRRYEADIYRLAYFDPLTDLPNRRLLNDRLVQALHKRDRTDQMIAVLMLDVDRFKRLNDSHGHAAGDQLLRTLACRLRGQVRSYDTVARLGGDEFVVLLDQLSADPKTAVSTAESVASALREVLDKPYELDVGISHHSVSIGVAVSLQRGDSAESLLRAADVALYAAKEAGRNIIQVFQPEMQQRVDQRSILEARLRAGFERGEVTVYYQAQVDAQGRLVGAEALMRWMQEGKPVVSPGEFIPIAEESGFIHELGCWNLETICRQIAHWGDQLPDGFRVAVNLAAAEFIHPDFPERVIDILRRTGTNGNRLRLEITEAMIVTDLSFVAERMHRLRAHNIEFSLDDFGAGYSSLTYLRKLPVTEVKIDQSYVQRVLVDRHDAAIVCAILAMCDSLNLRVMAEGIENEEVWHRLASDGCRYFQGYFFGRPQAPPEDPLSLLDLHPSEQRLTVGDACPTIRLTYPQIDQRFDGGTFAARKD